MKRPMALSIVAEFCPTEPKRRLERRRYRARRANEHNRETVREISVTPIRGREKGLRSPIHPRKRAESRQILR